MRRTVLALLVLAVLALAQFSASVPAAAATRFAVCSVTCTWDNSSTAMWSTSSGGATGASVPGSGDDVTLDANTCVGGVTCTITTNANLSVNSITMGTCTASTTGCVLDFSANNNNITLVTTFACTGTGTRTLKMGSGTWTVSAVSGIAWSCATTTNMTLAAGTSTVLFSGTATATRSVSLGNLTYNNVTVSNPAQNSFAVDMANGGNWTISGTLTLTNVLAWRLNFNGTQTVTGTISYNNGGAGKLGIIYTNAGASTLSVAGATTFDNAVIQNITKAGAGSISVTNGYDGGGNTGVSVTGPAPSGGGVIGG